MTKMLRILCRSAKYAVNDHPLCVTGAGAGRKRKEGILCGWNNSGIIFCAVQRIVYIGLFFLIRVNPNIVADSIGIAAEGGIDFVDIDRVRGADIYIRMIHPYFFVLIRLESGKHCLIQEPVSVKNGIEFFKWRFNAIVGKDSTGETGRAITGVLQIVLIVFMLTDGIGNIGSGNDNPADNLLVNSQKRIKITF